MKKALHASFLAFAGLSLVLFPPASATPAARHDVYQIDTYSNQSGKAGIQLLFRYDEKNNAYIRTLDGTCIIDGSHIIPFATITPENTQLSLPVSVTADFCNGHGQAIAGIYRKTAAIKVNDPPGKIHFDGIWYPDQSPLNPGEDVEDFYPENRKPETVSAPWYRHDADVRRNSHYGLFNINGENIRLQNKLKNTPQSNVIARYHHTHWVPLEITVTDNGMVSRHGAGTTVKVRQVTMTIKDLENNKVLKTLKLSGDIPRYAKKDKIPYRSRIRR